MYACISFGNTIFDFLQAIDAIDNGINQYDTDQPPRYVNNTHLSSRVGRFNLDWVDPDQSADKENEAFQRAMALAGSEFLDVSKNLQHGVKYLNIILIDTLRVFFFIKKLTLYGLKVCFFFKYQFLFFRVGTRNKGFTYVVHIIHVCIRNYQFFISECSLSCKVLVTCTVNYNEVSCSSV